jgi:hypothetical protein
MAGSPPGLAATVRRERSAGRHGAVSTLLRRASTRQPGSEARINRAGHPLGNGMSASLPPSLGNRVIILLGTLLFYGIGSVDRIRITVLVPLRILCFSSEIALGMRPVRARPKPHDPKGSLRTFLPRTFLV